MLNRADIILPKENNADLDYNFGSLLHGYIMENIGDYADALHAQGIKPYSQFVFYDKNQDCYVWRINTLSKSAYENIILPLKESVKKGIHIKNKNCDLVYTKILEYKQTDGNEFLKQYYKENEAKKSICVKFVTPCSFSSFKEHVFVPDIRLTVKSLMSKAEAYMEVSVKDEDALNALIENVKLKEYSIKSTVYYLNTVKIKSFIGSVTYSLEGPDMLRRLAAMLFAYGEYSGIGVKSAQGMGGIEILNFGG